MGKEGVAAAIVEDMIGGNWGAEGKGPVKWGASKRIPIEERLMMGVATWSTTMTLVPASAISDGGHSSEILPIAKAPSKEDTRDALEYVVIT